MYCTNCGHERPEGATACPSCGAPVVRFSAPAAIPNYLVQSILVTLCCCLPAGIVAIVFSAQVNTKLAAGDVAGAQDSSKKAKLWAWIGVGGGVLVAIVYAVVTAIAVTNAK